MENQEEKKYQIGKQILKEDDINKVITVKGETFKIKFPTPIEQAKIEREIALRIGAVPLDSIPAESYNVIRMCTTLDFVIQESPDWWEIAGDCYDEDLLSKLWEKYLDLREKFRRSIREGKFKRNST